jgi:hypothetical protein
MRILAQGKTTIGSGITQLVPTSKFAAGRTCEHVWVGAGDSNSAAVRVGINGTTPSEPQHFLDTTDKKGFEIKHDCPNDLRVTGSQGDVVRWVVYGN